MMPLSTYNVAPDGSLTDEAGNPAGHIDDYLSGVNDPQRVRELRQAALAEDPDADFGYGPGKLPPRDNAGGGWGDARSSRRGWGR